MSSFSLDYARSFMYAARRAGYISYTVNDFIEADCPTEGALVIKHDVDVNPTSRLGNLLGAELECDVRSTVYVRVTANDYNVMSYHVLPTLIEAEHEGFEIGLHTNFLEFAIINKLDPMKVLSAEVKLLKEFFNVRGLSTHRDFNYVHNALPWLEERWQDIKGRLDLKYHAYEPMLMDRTIYVNEGMKPHLCWRNMSPEDAIKTGKSVYMLTHPHWWFKEHPFES